MTADTDNTNHESLQGVEARAGAGEIKVSSSVGLQGVEAKAEAGEIRVETSSNVVATATRQRAPFSEHGMAERFAADPLFYRNLAAYVASELRRETYRNDYTMMWRGLPIGRIRKHPGLPAHIDQWSWGCNVYRQPSLSRDSGQGRDLENCKAKFKIAWVRIRAGLTDWDIAKAQKCGEGSRHSGSFPGSPLRVSGQAA
jgi:hypothetical protein